MFWTVPPKFILEPFFHGDIEDEKWKENIETRIWRPGALRLCRNCDTHAANNEIRQRLRSLKTAWLCKVGPGRQSWFRHGKASKATRMANILAGLAAFKKEGIQVQEELEKAILSKTLLQNASWKCFGPCGHNLRWDHFSMTTSKKRHGKQNLKHECGGQEPYASVATATRLQRTQSRR